LVLELGEALVHSECLADGVPQSEPQLELLWELVLEEQWLELVLEQQWLELVLERQWLELVLERQWLELRLERQWLELQLERQWSVPPKLDSWWGLELFHRELELSPRKSLLEPYYMLSLNY
jgi:hypothetical protein